MTEILGIPQGFEHGSVVVEGNSRPFCVLPQNIFEQAFPDAGAIVGEVNSKIVNGERIATKSLIFVSSILSGKYDSNLGDSPQSTVVKNYASARALKKI